MGEPTISHALALHPYIWSDGLGPGPVWELCVECDAVGSRALALLRGSLRCVDRFAAESAWSNAVPGARWPSAGRDRHLDVPGNGQAGGLEPVPHIGSDGGRRAAQLGLGPLVATGEGVTCRDWRSGDSLSANEIRVPATLLPVFSIFFIRELLAGCSGFQIFTTLRG